VVNKQTALSGSQSLASGFAGGQVIEAKPSGSLLGEFHTYLNFRLTRL
jgi:hypothetical protein